MKKISQIARECGVDKYNIRRLVDRENFVVTRSPMIMIDKHQEELIHKILYFEGKITEITLESKINL